MSDLKYHISPKALHTV